MLTRQEVKAGQFHRYKSPEDLIPAGLYYRSSKKIDEGLRRGLRCVAATEVKTQRFTWLMPYEPWVKRAAESWTPPEAKWLGKVPYDDAENAADIRRMFNLPMGLWVQLRHWHKVRLADACYQLSQFGRYRRGELAPIGAGKTLFGLCLAAHDPEHAVVLAPKHLHKGWADEAKKWGLPLPKLSTYHSAHHLIETEPTVVVGDEALFAMNPTTGLHKHFKALAELPTVKIAVGYTGSSCSTTPANLRWLRCVNAGCVPDDYAAWQHLWGKDTKLVEVAPERKVYVTKQWDTDAVAEFIEPYCGVVGLEEIKRELPAVDYQIIRTPAPQHWDLIRNGGGTENGASKRVAQARQIADGFILDDLGDASELDRNKIDAVAEWARSTEEPVVIYAAWDWTVSELAAELKDEAPALLRGGADYALEIEKFLSGQTRVLIANTRISTGMNLQGRCRLMAFASNGLSPIDRQQAEGRIVRPGQKDGCIIVDFVADGTLDEKQLQILKSHGELSETMVESMLARELAGRS